jgi:hypothetical protein
MYLKKLVYSKNPFKLRLFLEKKVTPMRIEPGTLGSKIPNFTPPLQKSQTFETLEFLTFLQKKGIIFFGSSQINELLSISFQGK